MYYVNYTPPPLFSPMLDGCVNSGKTLFIHLFKDLLKESGEYIEHFVYFVAHFMMTKKKGK